MTKLLKNDKSTSKTLGVATPPFPNTLYLEPIRVSFNNVYYNFEFKADYKLETLNIGANRFESAPPQYDIRHNNYYIGVYIPTVGQDKDIITIEIFSPRLWFEEFQFGIPSSQIKLFQLSFNERTPMTTLLNPDDRVMTNFIQYSEGFFNPYIVNIGVYEVKFVIPFNYFQMVIIIHRDFDPGIVGDPNYNKVSSTTKFGPLVDIEMQLNYSDSTSRLRRFSDGLVNRNNNGILSHIPGNIVPIYKSYYTNYNYTNKVVFDYIFDTIYIRTSFLPLNNKYFIMGEIYIQYNNFFEIYLTIDSTINNLILSSPFRNKGYNPLALDNAFSVGEEYSDFIINMNNIKLFEFKVKHKVFLDDIVDFTMKSAIIGTPNTYNIQSQFGKVFSVTLT